MKPRPFYTLSPIVAAALAWSLHGLAARTTAPPPAVAEAPPAAARPRPAIAGGDWTWRLGPNGAIRVLCKGSTVIDTAPVYWGPNWTWVGSSNPEFEPVPGGWSYRAELVALKTRVSARYRSPRPNELEMDFRLDSAETIPDAIGGGLIWKIRSEAQVFAGFGAKPTLPPDRTGWTWEPVPGQVARLTVEPAAAHVYIDAGVRVFFMHSGVRAGSKSFKLRLTLPEGATRVPSPEERYDPARPERWFPDALAWDSSPVDLRSLNADDRPAGRRGRIKADGDRLVLGDGSPVRLWGANLAAYAVLGTPRELVPVQARRMARLGYNLARIHQIDSRWVVPNVFGPKGASTRRLDPDALDKIDWWIKCLRDEGIYVWLDFHVYRSLQDADGPLLGREEIVKDKLRYLQGFSYFNDDVQRLMLEYQRALLGHVNRHTGLAYKDDPAIAFVLLTNENDVTNHFGNMFLPNKGRPVHGAIYMAAAKAFARERGLPEDRTWRSWEKGPATLFLADVEHRFNSKFLGDLRGMGAAALAATTNSWGNPLGSLAPLLDGDVVDVHSYGEPEFLDVDPRFEPNYADWIGAARVAGRPLTISEWNVEYPKTDRFCSPLYTAALAAFQGWDAPMLYNYSQDAAVKPKAPTTWSTWCDPALTGLMPAAALIFRKGQVAEARGGFHLAIPADRFYAGVSPATSAAIRTAMEQRRLTVGVPTSPAIPWLKPTPTPPGAEIVADPDRDLLADADSGAVRSDTGELTRDWKRGRHVIDAPRCQAVSGWIGGETLTTADVRFEIATKKAAVVLNSVDDLPLSRSRFILISAVARATADPSKRHAFVSEPVVGSIVLKTDVPDLELMALAADGRVAGRATPTVEAGTVRVDVPSLRGTHWYVLKAKGKSETPR